MECNNLFISCVVHKNDMEVGHYMMLVLKKCMRQTVRRDGSPPNSITKIQLHHCSKKQLIRLHLLIHSIGCCALPPQGTGSPSIGFHLVPFAHGIALLCLMTIFQIDLNSIKVFSIDLMFP